MTEDEVVLGLMAPAAVNFLLLYNKYDRWYNTPYKWYGITGIFVLAAVLLQFATFNNIDWYLSLRATLTPFIIVLSDHVFKRLSLLIQNRDYYLWFRDMSIEHYERKYTFWDKLFTVVLMVGAIFIPFALVLMNRA